MIIIERCWAVLRAAEGRALTALDLMHGIHQGRIPLRGEARLYSRDAPLFFFYFFFLPFSSLFASVPASGFVRGIEQCTACSATPGCLLSPSKSEFRNYDLNNTSDNHIRARARARVYAVIASLLGQLSR